MAGILGKRIVIVFIIPLILSCGTKVIRDKDYKIVKNNLQEFNNIANYIIEKNYHQSFERDLPLEYIEDGSDSILYEFQKKYNISVFHIYSDEPHFLEKKTKALTMTFARNFLQPRKSVIFDYSNRGIEYDKEYFNTVKLKDRVYFIKQ